MSLALPLLGLGGLAIYFLTRKSETKPQGEVSSGPTSPMSTPMPTNAGGATSEGWRGPISPPSRPGVYVPDSSSAVAAPDTGPAPSTEAPYTMTPERIARATRMMGRPSIDWCKEAREAARQAEGGVYGALSAEVAEVSNSIMGAPSYRALRATTECLTRADWATEKVRTALIACAATRKGLPDTSLSDAEFLSTRQAVSPCAALFLTE